MTTPNQDHLDSGLIRESMAPVAQEQLRQLTLLQATDSTNTAILRLARDRQHAHAVLAECQTEGRGRRERSWHSPAGGNIYLSLGWWFRPGILPRAATSTSAWVGGSGTAGGRFPHFP